MPPPTPRGLTSRCRRRRRLHVGNAAAERRCVRPTMNQEMRRLSSPLLRVDAQVIAVVLVWSTILASPPGTAAAVECINTTVTTRQAFQLASLVFQGKVIAIEDPHAPGLTQVLTFDVDKVWKGAVTERQTIYQAVSVESRIFTYGDHLVVFAHELSRESRLRVGLQSAGPPAFGHMSFNCVTDMPVDVDSELPRMPSWKPR